MKSILNYIYVEEKGKPFEAAKKTADRLYWFAQEHRYITPYADYMEYILMVLRAMTGDCNVSQECQEAVNFYFNCTGANEYPNAPSDYINTVREATKAFTAEYKIALEKTAETRRILDKSVVMIFDRKENAAVVDYIKYIQNFKPGTSLAIFYSALYDIGFIQGVRSERARRNGTPAAPNERTTAAVYQGRKHRRCCLS